MEYQIVLLSTRPKIRSTPAIISPILFSLCPLNRYVFYSAYLISACYAISLPFFGAFTFNYLLFLPIFFILTKPSGWLASSSANCDIFTYKSY
jgi:hypothetical protein